MGGRSYVFLGVTFALVACVVRAPTVEAAPVKAEFGKPASISVWQPDASGRITFSTFERGHLQGANLAVGDVNGDGVDEIVVGAGQDRSPDIRLYSSTGTLLGEFRAYEKWFKGGVRVAVGDVNGDGVDEIVTAPGPGMKSRIQVFDGKGTQLLQEEALAYAEGFLGGVHVAVHDMNEDGRADIITTPGPGGGPHVRLFNGAMENLGLDFFAFDAKMTDGITVAVLDTNRGSQIIIGIESWNEPMIRRFVITDRAYLLREFHAFDRQSRNGVRIAAVDIDADGVDEIAAVQNGGTIPEVRLFDMFGTLHQKYMLHDPDYRGTLSMASINSDGDLNEELVTVALSPVVVGPTDVEKKIDVNISQQKLYAFERGRLAKSFFISSGTHKHPTPIVDTTVLEKIPVKRYRWNYGTNHPDNYDLANVKWNMRIHGPVYIHGAYWHNNFGRRMSHGCINVDYKNAEWVYQWADVGIPVSTHY